MYEEDLRIPMIVLDPRIPAAARGQVRDELMLLKIGANRFRIVRTQC